MSVGVGAAIGDKKSFGDTFLRKIGSEDTYSASLYKTCWSLVGVNFLRFDDDKSFTGSMYDFITPSEF